MATVEKKNKQTGFYTLDQIVRMALKDLEVGLERYEQFLQWGIDCYNDYHMDMAREIKTVELPITAWKAIEWPDDYVDWTLIGIRRNGRLYVFSNDSEIPLYFDRGDDYEPQQNVEVEFSDESDINVTSDRNFIFRNFNGYGEDQGRLFGLAAKNNGVGYYRINRERREIQLNPIIVDSGNAYLEYISSGYSPCKTTIVPLYAAKLHKLYIHWQRLKFMKSATLGEKRDAEREYWDEWRRVQIRMDDLTIADVVEAAIDGYIAAPHF